MRKKFNKKKVLLRSGIKEKRKTLSIHRARQRRRWRQLKRQHLLRAV